MTDTIYTDNSKVNSALVAENERLQARVAELDAVIIGTAAKAELASRMMDNDARGQNIADAFLELRDWSIKKLERIRNKAKGADNAG